MRLLFVGDVVGRAGRTVVTERLRELREAWALDCVVVNGENSAGGFGITESVCRELLDAGADCITLGNHSFDQREALVFITREPRLIRPINYPQGTPGAGSAIVDVPAGRVLVVSAMGRVFMDAMDDPFAAVDAALEACPLGRVCDAAIVDFHAEATSEKMAFGHFCDGRASLVVGTHTHVPTADCQILTGGTAYQSDAGMTGDYDSVIGMEKDEPLRRMVQKTPGSRYEPASGPASLCGIAVETNGSGHAVQVAAVRVGGRLSESRPNFWNSGASAQ